MIKYCGSCGLRSQDGLHCGLTGLSIDPVSDYCSRHNDNPDICEICGNIMISGQIIASDGENYHVLCQNCGRSLDKCPTCGMAKNCLFQTDPSPIPQMVQQQIKQGNTIITTQVMNPDRIAITCVKCKCYKDNKCLRQTQGYCDGWEWIK